MAPGDKEAIGQRLLENGSISPQQLEAALRRQQELGGRLGTALLELGAISEDLLIQALGEQSSLPVVDLTELEQIPAEVLDLVPAKVAVRHSVVPFRKGRSRVDVAARDEPDIPALDELSFVVGRRVVVHVANEARIFEALERYYGQDCPLRFSHLIERLDRRESSAEEAVAAAPAVAVAAPSAAPAAPASPPAVSSQPAGGGPEPRAPKSAATKPAATEPAVPKPAAARPPRPTSVPLSDEEKKSLRHAEESQRRAKPLSLDEVHEALGVARSASDIGTALLGYLGQEFLRLLLFRVAQGKVRGWIGRSPALDQYRFRNWTVGFDEPSVFLNLRQGAEFFLGRLPAMPAHERLLKCWQGSFETECAVFPVKVRDRLVCALYGDRDSLGLAGLDVRVVQKLTAKAAIAFEMLLMQRRLKKS